VHHGEERKLVTVLFADIVGSTALAGDEDPERVRARLDRFYTAMAEEIERTGGTVEKFAGDAVMAAFGAPVALEDHAERALHAALAMHRRLAELFGDELSLRIGVNTGEVVVGQPRESSSFVTGDAVNVGARLEQAAAPGEVLAGERTVAAAGGAFEFGDARAIEAKGKPEGIAGRPVLRALSLARPRSAAGLRRVFIGRESELELLRATFRRAVAQGEPHLVTIVGEPGVGKTRLVRELWEVLAEEEPAPVRRTGRCLPYGDGITYWPLGEMLREHFGILESDSPEAVSARLESWEILGLALGLDAAGGLHPLDAREQLHAATVAFVEDELARDRPAVNVVEDIHWAEDDLLDLLDRVVREARAPVVLLATTRPELLDRRPTWGAGRRNVTTIWLEPLPEQDATRMLEELLGVELPAELERLLVRRAEGNPFFVEELVGELVDVGVIERANGGWVVRELPEGFSVPDSVQAVLAARIDRLPAREKAALQAASVVGRVFWPPPVIHLLDGAEPDLDLLEERDFVRRRAGSSMSGEREYAIKHALTREVAYASIPKARRGRLHATLADWLGAAGQGEEHAALLAYHYAEAVRPEDADLVWAGASVEHERVRRDAVRWLRRAGELARDRYELDESLELLTKAVDLVDDARERALLWSEIGRVQALRYDGEGFWKALGCALDGPLERSEIADVYSLLAFQTSIRSGMWVVRPERARIEDWVDRALEHADEVSVERARALLARANADPGDVSDAVVQEASRLAEKLGDGLLRSYAFAVRSHAAYDRLDFRAAAEWTARRLELAPSIEDPDHLCEVYESAAPAVAAIGHFDEARRLAAEHWAISQRLSPHHRVHSISVLLELEDAVGDWEGIVADERLVVELVEANRATHCVRNPRDLLILALAYSCLGDEARAAELAAVAEPLAGEGHERSLNPPRLRRALVRGDVGEVRALLELTPYRTFVWGPSVFGTRLDARLALRDREAIEREGPALVQARTYAEPFALRALGWARGDDELLARADERFRALGLEWHRAQTERLLAGL
jgi:class 3 adenylate cyclase